MKLVRTHDYPVQLEWRPNARALRGILTVLAVTAFFCFCVALALLPGLHTTPRVQVALRCTCDKACACCRDTGMTKARNAGANPTKD